MYIPPTSNAYAETHTDAHAYTYTQMHTHTHTHTQMQIQVELLAICSNTAIGENFNWQISVLYGLYGTCTHTQTHINIHLHMCTHAYRHNDCM